MLTASGPCRTRSAAVRRQAHPKRIALIQCVGSRDTSCGNAYCSSVCCMYATKEAMLAKEHACRARDDRFFMDMRAFGKGFDAYYERAKGTTACATSGLGPSRRPRHAELSSSTFARGQAGKLHEEEFDMVVLFRGPGALARGAQAGGQARRGAERVRLWRAGGYAPQTTQPRGRLHLRWLPRAQGHPGDGDAGAAPPLPRRALLAAAAAPSRAKRHPRSATSRRRRRASASSSATAAPTSRGWSTCPTWSSTPRRCRNVRLRRGQPLHLLHRHASRRSSRTRSASTA